MEREKVYQLIESERGYQEKRWMEGLRPDQIHDKDKSVAEWIVYMDFVLNKAKESVYNLNKEEALANIRKLSAICVACMEHNDTPSRK